MTICQEWEESSVPLPGSDEEWGRVVDSYGYIAMDKLLPLSHAIDMLLLIHPGAGKTMAICQGWETKQFPWKWKWGVGSLLLDRVYSYIQ